MLIAVLMLCGLRVYILSLRLKCGHFNHTPGREPTFASVPCAVNRHHNRWQNIIFPLHPLLSLLQSWSTLPLSHPPVVEVPPAVDPVLAPPPAPVLVADLALAVETVEEVISLAILLVLSLVYVLLSYFYPLSVALVPTFVSGSFIFSFSVLLFWVYLGNPV